METETGIEVNIDWEALSNSQYWLLLRAFIVDIQKEMYEYISLNIENKLTNKNIFDIISM